MYINVDIHINRPTVRPSVSDRPTVRLSDRTTIGPGPGPVGPIGSVKTDKTNSEYQNAHETYTNNFQTHINTIKSIQIHTNPYKSI